jgi:hypothetical protein
VYSVLRLPTAGKLTQQTSPAVHVCCTTTGRLFVTDRSSKRQFPVDTRSDLCVYPRRLVLRCEEGANYDLCASNGTTIYNYGWLPLSLNFDLRPDFTLRFVLADVTHPIIGVDFLSNFGLLVDCRTNRLLDGVTSQSVPAPATSALIPSIKTITGRTPFDSLFAEFHDLTHPAGVQRVVRHNTDHIRTVLHPPVTCRPRRRHRICSLSPKPSLKPCCGTDQLVARKAPGLRRYTLYPGRTTCSVPLAISETSTPVPLTNATLSDISMIPPTSSRLFHFQNRPRESLKPNSRPYRQYTEYGHYHSTRTYRVPFMSFGLCNAAQTYQN